MSHPVLEEIVRAKEPVRPEVLRRWQAVIRDEIIPRLARDEAEAPPTRATAKAGA